MEKSGLAAKIVGQERGAFPRVPIVRINRLRARTLATLTGNEFLGKGAGNPHLGPSKMNEGYSRH